MSNGADKVLEEALTGAVHGHKHCATLERRRRVDRLGDLLLGQHGRQFHRDLPAGDGGYDVWATEPDAEEELEGSHMHVVA